MAGDATGCKEWGESYDKAAHHTLQASADLANALTNYGAVLYAHGYNWGIANKSNPPPPQPDTGQVGEYAVSLPTSIPKEGGRGFEHHGGVKEFFDKLILEVASKFGKLPNADATKLSKAHTAWNTFATHQTLTGAAASISSISGLFDSMDDATNRQLIQEHFTTLKTGADNVATSAQNIAAPVAHYHDATVSFGNDTANKINWLEAGIAAAAVAGIALAIFTVGMSVEVAGEGIAAAVTATIGAIQEAFSASAMAEILGFTALAVTAVAAVKAFQAVPVDDLEKNAAKLAAIIAMKVLIDANSGATDDLGESDKSGQSTPTDRIKEHLTDRDLDAARRELNGEVVATKPDGTPWDHVNEVKDAQNGLIKRIGQLNRRLSWPGLSAEERPLVEAELSEASRLLDHSEQYVPRQ